MPTDNFLIPSRTGVEFVDFKKEHWDIHHWVRGGCLYGVMPCNGLTYTPPHNCACYPEAKLYGCADGCVYCLKADDKFVYMRSQKFDLEGNRLEIGPISGDFVKQGSAQRGEGVHLFAPMGFLDDSWFHRSYWVMGRSFAGGHGGYYQAGRFAPSGDIMVKGGGGGKGKKANGTANAGNAVAGEEPRNSLVEPKWTTDVPIYVRAMVIAGFHLYIVGPPDIIDEEATFQKLSEKDAEVQKLLSAQDAAIEGQQGAKLLTVNTETGEIENTVELDTLPSWDGSALIRLKRNCRMFRNNSHFNSFVVVPLK